MKNISKIGTFEAIALIVVIMINKIILNSPKQIITQAGTGAWTNTIYISIIALLLVLLLSKLYKGFQGKDILDISEFLSGKILKIIIGIGYIGIVVTLCIFLLRYFSENLKSIYYPNSPIIFIMLFFLIATVITNVIGLSPMLKTNLIIMPITLISFFMVFFSSFKFFTPQRLYPVLGFGFNQTFIHGLSNIFSFGEIGYLFFIMPFLKNTKKFKKIAIWAIIISSFFLILSVLCLLLAFPFMPFTDETLSLYLITRLIQYGTFFERVDAIFIFIWIISAMSYFSISCFFVLHVIKRITNISNQSILIYPLVAIILGVSLFLKDVAQVNTLLNIVYRYGLIIFIFIIPFLILILANLKKNKMQKECKKYA